MGSAAENFDAFFKDRLEHFEESPPEAVWDNIAEQLGHSGKKRMVFFITRIAAGMIITLSLSLGYYFYTQNRNLTLQPAVASKPDELKKSGGAINITSDAYEKHLGINDPESFNDLPFAGAGIAGSPENEIRHHQDNKVLTAADSPNRFSFDKDQLPAFLLSIPALIDFSPVLPPVEVQRPTAAAEIKSTTDLIMMENLAQISADEALKNQSDDWMLGGQVAPLYSYRNLSSDYLSEHELKSLNNKENGILAYAGGFAVTYMASGRLSVQSGLYYSKYGQEKTGLMKITMGPEIEGNDALYGSGDQLVQMAISNSTGNITNQKSRNSRMEYANTITQSDEKNLDVIIIAANTSNLAGQTSTDVTAFQYFEYVELPLLLKYKIIDRKLDFSLTGGLSTNLLFNTSVHINDNGTDYYYGKTDNIARVNYSSSVGIGLEYPVLSNLFFSLEPKFRYYLNPLDKSPNLNVYPYSLGIFAGVSYTF
jgi:hypothetical protein